MANVTNDLVGYSEDELGALKERIPEGALDDFVDSEAGRLGIPDTEAHALLDVFFEWIIEQSGHRADPDTQELVDAIVRAPVRTQLSQAELDNANRVRELRRHLISGPPGGLSYEQLAEVRGASVETTRTFVSRHRNYGHLFTVRNGDEVIIPRMFFDDAFDLVRDFKPVLDIMSKAKIQSWSMWAWLAGPSRLLHGEIPAEQLSMDAESVLHAARARFEYDG